MRDVLVLCFGTCLLGCGAPGTHPASTAQQPTSLSARACPEGSLLTYDNFGGPFFSNWCTGCHGSAVAKRQGAPDGIDFDTLEGIRASAARIWARAADANATMPPAGGPEAEERELLGEWLACGMP
jgi:uncharacterized membrane protein